MPRREEPRRPRIRQTWVRFPAQRAQPASRAAERFLRAKAYAIPHEAVRVRATKSAAQPVRIAVLVSGAGRELRALISELDRRTIDGEIVAVITDNADATGVGFAASRGIRTVVFDPARFVDTTALTKEVEDMLRKIGPDIVLVDDFSRSIKLPLGRVRHVVDRAETMLKVVTTG